MDRGDFIEGTFDKRRAIDDKAYALHLSFVAPMKLPCGSGSLARLQR